MQVWMDGWRGRTRGTEAVAEPAVVLQNLPDGGVGGMSDGAPRPTLMNPLERGDTSRHSRAATTLWLALDRTFVRDDFNASTQLALVTEARQLKQLLGAIDRCLAA